MPAIRFIQFFTLIFACFTPLLYAHSEGLYVCQFTQETIQVDGKEDEAWNTTAAVHVEKKDGDTEGKDFSATWKALWDNKNIYFFIRADDDDLIASNLVQTVSNDCVQFYFDMKDTEFEQNQLVLHIQDEKSGKPYLYMQMPYKEDITSRGVQIATHPRKDGYTLEIAIPHKIWREENSFILKPGTQIGFDIQFTDKDNGKERIGNHYWSGNGNNWYDPSQNGRMIFQKRADKTSLKNIPKQQSWSTRFGWGLWEGPKLLTGNYLLRMPCKSYLKSDYHPWHFGEITADIFNYSQELVAYSFGKLGIQSGGEHFGQERFAYNTLYSNAKAHPLEITRIDSLFHPARMFQSNNLHITLFSNMQKLQQPSGPSFLFLPLRDGIAMKKVEPSVLYDSVTMGDFKHGWMLALFCREGDGRDNDIPMLITFSKSPSRIRALSESDGGGLEFEFPKGMYSFGLLPLLGAGEISREQSLAWSSGGTLPEEIHKRINFWYRSSIKIPVDMEETFSINKEKATLHSRFIYTQQNNQFGDSPILLSPVSQFLTLSARELPFGNNKLENFSMPLYGGPYWGLANVNEITYTLRVPQIEKEAPSYDLAKLGRDPLGKKYLAELNNGRFLQFVTNNVNKALNSPTPLLHTAMNYTWYSAYPFLKPENRKYFLQEMRKVFDELIFNSKRRDEFFPVRYWNYNADYEYRHLTIPYGCPEPWWNIQHLLASIGAYAFYTGDYSYYKNNWDFIKSLARMTSVGGFYQYRYDGGRLQGFAMEGLIRAAERLGDKEYYSQTLLMYSKYANTMGGWYRLGEWVKENNLWSGLGVNPGAEGDVQATTRAGCGIMPYYERGKSIVWDASYGNTKLIDQFAREEVMFIEQQLLPRYKPNWHKGEQWSGIFGILGYGLWARLDVRSRILKESPEQLDRYITGIKKYDKLFAHTYDPYASMAATVLERICNDQK